MFSLSLSLLKKNERKSEQAHIPHAPTLLENAVYNECMAIPSISDGQSDRKPVSFELHRIILAKVQKGYKLLLKKTISAFPVNIMSFITTKFHEILLSSFSGVALTNCLIVVKFLSSKWGITPRKKIESEFNVDYTSTH